MDQHSTHQHSTHCVVREEGRADPQEVDVNEWFWMDDLFKKERGKGDFLQNKKRACYPAARRSEMPCVPPYSTRISAFCMSQEEGQKRAKRIRSEEK